MSYFLPDVIGFPGTGTPQQNLSDIVCGAPKGASDQLAHVLYAGNRMAGPTSGIYENYNNRFSLQVLIISVSG